MLYTEIHKEIKLQDGMNGIDNIPCKTDLNPNRRLTYISPTPSTMYTLKHVVSSINQPSSRISAVMCVCKLLIAVSAVSSTLYPRFPVHRIQHMYSLTPKPVEKRNPQHPSLLIAVKVHRL